MKSTNHNGKLWLMLPILLLLSSCISIYFDQPQPKGGTLLSNVPDELHGYWVNEPDGDTIYIDATGRYKFVFDSVNNIYDREGSYLSDSLLLYKAGDYYVANYTNDGFWWEVLIIERKENGDICFYSPKTAPYFGKGHGLKVLKIVQVFESRPIKDYPIGRERRVLFRKRLSMKNVYSRDAVYYKGQFRIKDIDKVVIPENLDETFTFDGE